jgi:hypothetical protein
VFDGEGLIKQELRWGKVLYAKAFPVKDDGSADWNGAVDVQSKIGTPTCGKYTRAARAFPFTAASASSPARIQSSFTGRPRRAAGAFSPSSSNEMEDFKYFGGFVDPVNPAACRPTSATPRALLQGLRGILRHHHQGYFYRRNRAQLRAGNPVVKPHAELFYKKNGYDLIGRLPALLAKTDGDDEKFLYDFHNTITEAFIDSFDKPLRKWCDERGIAFTGEKPHYRLNQVAHMKLPGTANGHVKVGAAPTVHPGYYRASAKIADSTRTLRGQLRPCARRTILVGT